MSLSKILIWKIMISLIKFEPTKVTSTGINLFPGIWTYLRASEWKKTPKHSLIYSLHFSIYHEIIKFYHGSCKDQRDAAVILLRFMLRHRLWEIIHTSPFYIMCGKPCVWNSTACQLNIDSGCLCSVDHVYFVFAC